MSVTRRRPSVLCVRARIYKISINGGAGGGTSGRGVHQYISNLSNRVRRYYTGGERAAPAGIRSVPPPPSRFNRGAFRRRRF